jgi:hypothetical protein
MLQMELPGSTTGWRGFDRIWERIEHSARRNQSVKVATVTTKNPVAVAASAYLSEVARKMLASAATKRKDEQDSNAGSHKEEPSPKRSRATKNPLRRKAAAP